MCRIASELQHAARVTFPIDHPDHLTLLHLADETYRLCLGCDFGGKSND